MVRIVRNTIVACLFAAITLLASTSLSYACSPSGSPPTIETTVNGADVIVVAEVIGTYITPEYHANLHVTKYLKGSGPDLLVSEGYGSGGGDCRDKVFSGLQGIFYLNGNPDNNETLKASYAYPYAAVVEPDIETIKQIIQITGQETLPSPASFETRLHVISESLPWLLLGIFTVVAPLVVALCFLAVIGKVLVFFARLVTGTDEITKEGT